ncbi:MAG: AMP-binding protein [Novosphingobium sp.]|uniref:AMP-binding protein n=1 Tax=Novosphingobium sp. TaxID=1874826 RepID=UPI00301814B1
MPTPLVDLLRRHAAETPEAPCLAQGDVLLTFAELDARSDRLAHSLQAAGVGRGDRVAVLDKSGIATFELFFACAKLAAILMPLNWRLAAGEVADILADGAPKLVFVAPELTGLLEEAGDIAALLLEDGSAPRACGADTAPLPPCHAPDDPVLLLYTSGTTGKPKGVVITHGSHAWNGRIASEVWGFTAQSVNLVASPLFHIGGMGYGMMAMAQGGLTVLMQPSEPGAVLATMARHGVTHAFFVPTVIQRLVEHVEETGLAPPRLQLMVYGAAPIAEDLLRRALAAFGCGFSHAYGMTETSGTIVSLAPEYHDPDGPNPARLRSCGRPFPWVELALFDPATGARVAPGEVGEVRIRSAMNMQGYWNKPAETAATVTADGWLCTGDAAIADEEGFLTIHDRYKDMIVSGGENIYPAELENVLAAHPAVAEVAVIGTAHPQWGETPRAYVVPRGVVPGEAELIQYTRMRLARYKCPTSVVFVPTLPRNATGKLNKGELRRIDRARSGQE